MNIESAIGDYKSFLNKVFKHLIEAGFGLDEFKELDHIAYRVKSNKKYEEMKNKLKDFYSDFSEVQISGRPILVCKLKDQFIYNQYEIKCLELLAPKAGKQYQNGLEHAEFVTKTTLEEFLEMHKDVEFKMDAYEREINPEIKLIFSDCSIKFHTQSLLEIRNM
jgi:predicted metalloenzyme YecM